MTSQGHPYAIYNRAVRARDLSAAHAAAYELGPHVAPGQTLRLVLLYLEFAPDQYPRVAARWAAQVARAGPITVTQLADLADALHELTVDRSEGSAALMALDSAFELRGVRAALVEAFGDATARPR